MKGRWQAALGIVVAVASACVDDRGEEAAVREEGMTPLDRLLIGRATEYPADPALRRALPTLRASEKARREAAWAVARRVLEPVIVDGGLALPRFQSWYARDEILPIFDWMLRRQSAEDLAARRPPPAALVDEAFAWEAERAKTLPSWSEARLAKRRAELAENGASSLGGPERVLMSPALVKHLYTHYDAILGCIGNAPPPDAAPPSATNFAPCVGEEFPPGAAIVKARWIPDTLPLEAHDTSAAGLSATLAAGEWGPAARTASPDDASIYSMKLPNGIRMRLAALHVVTKELRDWVWVTLFWSDTPDDDLGQDRPADFTGPLAHYKMCVTVDYDEADPGPEDDSSLGRALAATRAFGPRTWCSNPYLEQGRGNAKTNCIGCHQHGGTSLTSTTVLEGPLAFPDGSRARHRENFPADYLFVTGTGLELATLMKAKVEQLAPPPP